MLSALWDLCVSSFKVGPRRRCPWRAGLERQCVVLVPILAFLFILSGPRIRGILGKVFARQAVWQRIVDDLDHLLGRYIRALLLLSLVAFAAYAVVLSSIGVPYALLLAALAGLLEFVPVFGPLSATIIIILVAALADYPHLLWIVIFIAGYRVFQDYVLGPKLMGSGVGVHPILILFGLLAGEELAGVAGIFFSVPTIAAAMIIARHLTNDWGLTRQPRESSQDSDIR